MLSGLYNDFVNKISDIVKIDPRFDVFKSLILLKQSSLEKQLLLGISENTVILSQLSINPPRIICYAEYGIPPGKHLFTASYNITRCNAVDAVSDNFFEICQIE
jgi:hypothetical protein